MRKHKTTREFFFTGRTMETAERFPRPKGEGGVNKRVSRTESSGLCEVPMMNTFA